jgi:hypothetical protein
LTEQGPEVMLQDEVDVAESTPQPRRKKRYLLDYIFGDDEAPIRKPRRLADDEGLY